ncbi:nesprin-2 isoform X2 [Syngnathoides biaculeatus]|uniref:nesprin-2 isoform X2 n=1 Tax=Syngnathoides biaculeatus TaxID=300417 RepID=UPI002ADE8863|nr:nesprin-2 isoform X2 [Syngnathoides biaculeatus]XP_061683123.1 nesprin-2 isoform X2 [Syngnathoides biaculeatus]
MSGLDTPPWQRHDDARAWTEDQDGDLTGLERRWLLWQGFMKEHAQLDTWLRLAEVVVASHDWSRVTYAGAKDDVRRFERLRCEAVSQLVCLDTLTQRNRTLTVLFQGAMRARLLDAARDCRRRWDRLNFKLESISRRLEDLVCEWEEFEEETEELAVWLAEMEVRLVEVQHVTGNACDKLKQLESFRRSVGLKCARVNGVLERGEELIQRGAPCDARRVERRLLELLRQCRRVDDNVGRARTRLLSMRLVFEDDFPLSPPPDSGCPSETLFEDEGELGKVHQDLFVSPKDDRLYRRGSLSLSSPFHEHSALEWDPSVDVGRGDFSYDAAGTGLQESTKRLSYFGSLASDVVLPRLNEPPVLPDADVASGPAARRVTSTPEHDGEPDGLDGRVRAWLGVRSPVRPSCCKAVQAGCQSEDEDEDEEKQDEDDDEFCSRGGHQSMREARRAAKRLLLAALASLLACLFWSWLAPPCRGNLHLSYVNGPPPT